MSESPHMDLPRYNSLLEKVAVNHGYDTSKIILVPQKRNETTDASDLSSSLANVELNSDDQAVGVAAGAGEEEKNDGDFVPAGTADAKQ